MQGFSHLLFGAGCTLLATQHGMLPTTLPVIAAGCLGALLPDVDHPKSMIGRRIPVLPNILYNAFGHRQLTHSGGVVLGILAIYAYYGAPWLLALAIGYISHLLGDMVFGNGVPIFYPSRYRIAAPFTFQVGSLQERLLQVAMLAGFFFFSGRMPTGL